MGKCLSIILLFLLSLQATAGVSTHTDGLRQERNLATFGKGVAKTAQGHATTQRTTVFQDLLGTKGDSPGWPAFPRLWYEEYRLKNISSNTYWNPSIRAISGGLEIDFQYGMKTTLVLVTSIKNPSRSTRDGEIINASAFEILKIDPKTRRIYPNLQEDAPMVAFCSFELSFAMENSRTLGIEAFGLGTKLKHKNIRGVNQTVYSRFFTVPPAISVEALFQGYCEKTFRDSVKPLVERNFVPMVVEQTLQHHPNNQCRPETRSTKHGDLDCLEWFSGFDIIKRNVMVPRCETVPKGFSVCRLRAKKGRSCPLYRDKQGRIHDRVAKHGLVALTKTRYAAPCDKGLRCTFDKRPREYLGGLILWKGEASCK